MSAAGSLYFPEGAAKERHPGLARRISIRRFPQSWPRLQHGLGLLLRSRLTLIAPFSPLVAVNVGDRLAILPGRRCDSKAPWPSPEDINREISKREYIHSCPPRPDQSKKLTDKSRRSSRTSDILVAPSEVLVILSTCVLSLCSLVLR